jgi:hypothetical protein
MGQVMNFQGQIPKRAADIAQDVMSLTRWQKYIVYDLLMELAVRFQDVDVGPMNREQQVYASHKSTHPIHRSDEMERFRIMHRTGGKNAEIFRHAMHGGAEIMRGFLDDTLPAHVTRQEVYDAVADAIGTYRKLQEGLETLKKRLGPKPGSGSVKAVG